jgi:hypothetical protein
MATQTEITSLKDMDIDEESLEFSLYDIGPDFDDLLGYGFVGVKRLIKEKGDLNITPSNSNPFVRQGYYFNRNGNPIFYPVYSPTTEFEATINEYRQVFDNHCTLVLCEANGREFIYFDPESRNKQYDKSINQKRKIKLAAIAQSQPDNYPCSNEVDEYSESGFIRDLFLSNGKKWRIPGYQTVFEVKSTERIDSSEYGKFARFIVVNPIVQKRDLELIAVTSGFSPEIETKHIAAAFYFLGTL